MAPTEKKNIITPEGMGSFINFLVPKAWPAGPGEAPKAPTYGMTLIFPPSGEQKYAPGGKADLKPLKAAVLAVAKDFFGDKKLAELSKAGKFRSPFLTDDEACEKYGWPLGSTFIRLSTTTKLPIMGPWKGPDGHPYELTDDQITKLCYPGARFRASVRPFGYDKKGNRGVSLGLQNIQYLGEDTRIDGRTSAKDEFSATAEPAEMSEGSTADEVDLSGVL